MNVHTYTLGQLSTNCYLIENGKQAVIIDPVDSADFLLEEISRHNLTLMALLATHGHFDHILAAGEIQLAFTGARSVPLYLNENDVFLVNRMEQSARYFLGYNPVTIKPSMIEPLQDGVLNVEPFQFVVIPTPGHTPGSVSFYWNNQSTLFSGDTLFAGSVGRFDLSYCSKEDLKQSVARLARYPGETVVYPGHGPSTTIGQEQDVFRMMRKI